MGGSPTQPDITAAMERSSSADVRVVNHALLTTSIADLFHAHNIPDSVVESPRFMKLLECARAVGQAYRCPNRHDIGGDLLEVNFKNYRDANLTVATRDAATFGLVVMGDGATIKRMPLLNALVINGNSHPVVAAIRDCTKHMSMAGKKDAIFISDIFKGVVQDYDEDGTLVDLFYFDGASNVEKAGKILMVKFPRTFAYHGGEHVVALWFTSLARIPAIKVCLFLSFFFSVGA